MELNFFNPKSAIMKNYLAPIFVTSLLIFIACATEIVAPVQIAQVNLATDTIVVLDPNTFEKIVKVVVPEDEAIPNAIYETDTVITFDADNFEETMEIIRTRVISVDEGNAKEHILKMDQMIENSNHEHLYQIDTIITFDPETFEETIQVIKTKKKNNQKGN